jgi:hypothetical protein
VEDRETKGNFWSGETMKTAFHAEKIPRNKITTEINEAN